MKRLLFVCAAILAVLCGCDRTSHNGTKTPESPTDTAAVTPAVTPEKGKDTAKDGDKSEKPLPPVPRSFWLGADISWETEMEQRGEKLYNFTGDEEWECTALMKDLGLNAVRFRVWVDPHGGLCDKKDLLAKCIKAKREGLKIMVDFHYSDYWADPSAQSVPKAWKGHSYEQMKEDLKGHTVEVLTLLKENGIEPNWVQIGNETTNGLLWSRKKGRGEMGSTVVEYEDTVGHIDFAPEQYAGFIQTGNDAVKSVFPSCKTIVHLDNGWDFSIYEKNLGILEKYGVSYDIVGMSLYPYWARDRGRNDADGVITDCIANVSKVYRRFGKESMIVETGFEVDETRPALIEEGRRQLSEVISAAALKTGGHCLGVFYWEPECRPSRYKLGAFGSDGRPTAIMLAFKEASR